MVSVEVIVAISAGSVAGVSLVLFALWYLFVRRRGFNALGQPAISAPPSQARTSVTDWSFSGLRGKHVSSELEPLQ